MIANPSMTTAEIVAKADCIFGIVDVATLQTEVIAITAGYATHPMVARDTDGNIINAESVTTEQARAMYKTRHFDVVGDEVVFVKGGA